MVDVTGAHPLVSVVMPNYNKEHFVATAIESVLAQTLTDIELIVVEDSSTDSSVSRVEAFLARDHRLVLVKTPTRMGAGASRNRGIALARGKHLGFLDSDDFFAPTWLEHGLEVLRAYGEPAVVYSDWFAVNRTGVRLRGARPHTTRSGVLFSDFLTQALEVNTAIIAPRSCFAEIGGYDESIQWGEDYDMVLRLASRYPFLHLNEEAYGYRLYAGNSWKQFPQSTMYDHKAALLERHLRAGSNFLTPTQRSAVESRLASYVSRSIPGSPGPGQVKKVAE